MWVLLLWERASLDSEQVFICYYYSCIFMTDIEFRFQIGCNWNIHWNTPVTYIAAGIQLYKSPEGGQLKNQQPSKSPSSASAQKRGFSSCCGTKGMCGNASQRHSFISWLSKHTQRNIWILMCTLSLICLWNMNINLGKRGLISNRALTWNV